MHNLNSYRQRSDSIKSCSSNISRNEKASKYKNNLFYESELNQTTGAYQVEFSIDYIKKKCVKNFRKISFVILKKYSKQ